MGLASTTDSQLREDSSDQDDFLSQIVCGEDYIYNKAYHSEFSSDYNLNNTDQLSSATDNVTKARQLGIIHGAKLASEFGFCYGMVLEIISSRQQFHYFNTSSTTNLNVDHHNHRIELMKKKNNHIFKLASNLYEYLINSPGLIQLSNNNSPQLNKTIKLTFDENDEILKFVRNKMKQLKSLLDIHSINEKMSNLTF
ncbi:hypothetical protein MN116_005495 [Schistosoma mekongi]|uniref:Uncharacterized protein n=1 Tax=Schistosoma mekongi TaxID=38744 RepID=A0AAE1ZBG0_SCHME|nr:hypothetical protein MN116_005495 [Schistosoma mekongi]